MLANWTSRSLRDIIHCSVARWAIQGRHRLGRSVTPEEDIESVAGQMADLTRTVEELAQQLKMLRERSDDQLERSNTQQERIDLAARELTQVSDRLQSAANALRQTI